MRHLTVLFAALLSLLPACQEVDPSNPFDPGTPAEQQAAGTLSGAVVLPAGFGAARLGAGAVELWRRDEAIARIALTPTADAEPPRAPFAFESVVGGRYTLRVEVPGFSLPPMQVVLAIGESLSLGDLRLVATPQAADAAPTGVQGVARRAGGGETGHGGIRVDVVDTPYTAATTDAGAFQLPLAPATYTLRFSADGHEPETVADVAVGTDGFTALPGEVVLQGAPARLFGRLSPPVGFDGAFDFAEVRVGLWPADAVEDAEPSTLAPVDARGDFDLPGLDAGRYRLQARREGFLGTLALATAAPGQALEVPGLTLQAVVADEGLLSGQARLGGASDHSNVRVELVGSERSASSNADGDWALRAPPGVHILRFTRAGYGTAQVQAPRLDAGGAAMVDPVVLAADPGSVRGQVRLDPAFGGRALLPQVAVRLARIEADGTLTAAGEAGVLPAEGDAELGTFAFENLPPSDYQVEVRLEGFQPAFRAVAVAPGAAATTGVIFLSPNAAEAVVLGQARRACAACDHGGIRVEAVGTPFITLTNGDGDFRLAVTDGQFTLRYSAPGHGTVVGAPLAVEAGAPAQAPAVVLPALPAGVTGQALRVDGAGRQGPAVGATVTVADGDGEVLAAGPVGEDGRVALSVAAEGAAVVTVSLPRHSPVRREVELAPGETTALGELLLDLERGELQGAVSAPGLARGGSVTVVATGAVGDAVTAGLRHTATPPPGEGRWALPRLPAGGWVVTAVAAEHVPSDPQAVQLALGQVLTVDLALQARDVRVDAPAVVAGDAVPITVAGDADLTHARAWLDGAPGALQPLQGGVLIRPLPAEDGAYAVTVQVGNALAAEPAAGDPTAYLSTPLVLGVVRDTTAPDVWALEGPARVTAPEVLLSLDCRDALAPADGLTVQITVDGQPAFEGPFTPRVRVPLPDADGEYLLEGTCRDWAGHEAAPLAQAVRLDRQGPTVRTFRVGDGTPNQVQAAPQAVVTVALDDTDVAMATAIEEGALDCAHANYRWPAGGTFVVPLPAGDGPRRLSLCARDRAGNTTGPIQSNPFIVDSTAPAVGRLTLADDAGWTRNPQVALTVDTDEPGLRLRLDGDVAAAEYAPGAWPAQVTLLGADGPKVVTAQLVDAAGNPSPAFTGTVTLDRQPPAAGRVRVADGRAQVNARLVPVSIAGTNPDSMRFWEGAPAAPCAAVACEAEGFEPFSPATELTLSEGTGAKRVCWQLCDFAGNAAPAGQTDLRLDTYLPRPAPTLAQVSPSVLQAFEAGARITLRGAGIAADTQVVISDFEVPCEGGGAACQADPLQGCADVCTATLPAAVLASAGTYAVSLRTPGPGGGRSEVRFLSVVAPIAKIIDLAPRGFTPFDEDGARVDTVELTVLGYDLLDNTTFRLESVSGEVVASEALDLDGVPEGRPQRAVTVRFDAAPLPVPREGVRLTLSVTNPSPGGGTVQVPVGWNPELADCDVQAGCRSQLDRFRTPTARGGEVAQAYFVSWPTEGGVAWRGGTRARLLEEGVPTGFATVAQAPVEVLPVPDRLGEGLVLEGPPEANPGVNLAPAPWRTSGALDEVGDFRAFTVADQTRFVRAHDLTGDGWPDLVAAGPEVLAPARCGLTLIQGAVDPDRPGDTAGAALSDYRATQTRVALGQGELRALEVADLDGDDWPDVIALMADRVQVLRGQPRGLAPPLVLANAAAPWVDLALGDWDGDGRTDGRLVDEDGHLHRLSHEADGALRVRPLPELPAFPVRTLEAGDLDGDRVPDLLGVIAPPDGAPALTALLSTRGFQAPVASAEAPAYPHPDLRPSLQARAAGPTLALGDLDGDGALDAVHNSIGSEVWVYRGLGDGRFERRQVLPRGVNPATGPLDDTRDIHLLDMTGDGWLDLVYAASPNFLRFPAAVVPGRGDGTFPDPRFPGADTAITGSAQIHDVNGDGRLDLVHFSRGGRILSFQLGEGGRALDRRQVLDCADPDTCHASTRAALADVTGDGRPDLLFPARDRLVVRRQRPDGTFEADRSLALENLRPQPPQLGPWAADGGLAVVVTQAYVPAEPANRQGVVSRVPLGAGGQPGTPQVILDDDSRRLGALVVPRAGGEAWLVEVLRSPAQLRVARYTPATNTVHAASTVDLPGDPGVLLNHARGDLDGDGAADLVLLTRGGAVVLRQTAAGFERVGDPLGPCFDAADVGDLDGDGRADLVLGAFVAGQPGQLCQEANPDGGGLTVMWGDGALGFEAQPIGGLGFHVTVADMNGDGLDDIVHTVTDPLPLVGVFLSQPGRRVAPYAPRALEGAVHGTVAADLDGDGLQEVLINRELSAFQDGIGARGFVIWRGASPITQRLRSGGPQDTRVAPGATARVALAGDRRFLERVGLGLQLEVAAPVVPDAIAVRLVPPGGAPAALAGLTADGLRLRLHARSVVAPGWYDAGLWQVEITNGSAVPIMVTDARLIAVGGDRVPLE